jgi:hypothetical protein
MQRRAKEIGREFWGLENMDGKEMMDGYGMDSLQ